MSQISLWISISGENAHVDVAVTVIIIIIIGECFSDIQAVRSI
jgi:hypothetical protein